MIISLIVGILLYWNKSDTKKNEKVHKLEEYTILLDGKYIVESQNNTNDDAINSVKTGIHKMDKPLILVNPYGFSPLTALVGFQTDEETEIQITLLGKTENIIFESSLKKDHLIPIYGLYPNTRNNLKIEDKTNNVTSELVIITEESHYDEIDLSSAKLSKKLSDNDFYFLSSKENKFVSAYDSNGDLRWHFTPSTFNLVSSLHNGNFLMSLLHGTEGETIVLAEIDLLGKIHKTYDLNHPFIYLYEIVSADRIKYLSTNNKLIEFDLKKGQTINVIDINKIITDIDSTQIDQLGLTYLDTDKNNFIKSIKEYEDETLITLHYDAVISLKNDKLNWILSKPNIFSDKFENFLLKGDISENINSAELIDDNLLLSFSNYELLEECKTSYSLQVKEYKIINKTLEIINEKTYDYKHLAANNSYYKLDENEYVLNYSNDKITDEVKSCLGNKQTLSIYKNSNAIATYSFQNNYDYFEKKPLKYSANFKSKTTYLKDKFDNYNYKKENYSIKYENSNFNGVYLELFENTLVAYFDANDYKIVLMDQLGNGYIYTPINNTIRFDSLNGFSLVLIELEGEIYNTGYYINNTSEQNN